MKLSAPVAYNSQILTIKWSSTLDTLNLATPETIYSIPEVNMSLVLSTRCQITLASRTLCTRSVIHFFTDPSRVCTWDIDWGWLAHYWWRVWDLSSLPVLHALTKQPHIFKLPPTANRPKFTDKERWQCLSIRNLFSPVFHPRTGSNLFNVACPSYSLKDVAYHAGFAPPAFDRAVLHRDSLSTDLTPSQILKLSIAVFWLLQPIMDVFIFLLHVSALDIC